MNDDSNNSNDQKAMITMNKTLAPLTPSTLCMTMILLSWVGVSSCKQPGDTKWQFFPDMADGAAVGSQMAPINPPDGSVATDALLYEDNALLTEKTFGDGATAIPESRHEFFRLRGKHHYQTFCVHCHGPKGQGNGTITDVYPQPPDLTDPLYIKRKDGFFFHTITFGGALMPSLGHAISQLERTMIIFHIRKLQQDAQATKDDSPVSNTEDSGQNSQPDSEN